MLVKSWELLEYHIVGLTAPEEFLLWELITVFVTNSESNKVVATFDSANSSPE